MSGLCVKVKNLTKRFWVFRNEKTTFRVLKSLIRREPFKKEFWVLKDLSFEIAAGEKVAIVGKNGAGKTTLLRILAGIYDRTSGELAIHGHPRVMLKLHIGLKGDLPVIDNIYLFGAIHGMRREALRGRVDEILSTAELSHLRYLPVKELSVGQLQRLLLSVFFQLEEDFLVFDEVFASVDQDFAKKCDSYFNRLSSSSKTIIMISHDTSFLRKYCRTAIWLNEGIVRMKGPIDEVLSAYEKSFGG